MTTEITKKEYSIDASNMRLGTLATQAAAILLGKKTPDYARHLAADVTLTISNVSKLDVTEKKKHEIYQSYSGYPGGRKIETLDHLGNRLGYAEVVRRTIAGMLPNNKLKKPMLKNLVITE